LALQAEGHRFDPTLIRFDRFAFSLARAANRLRLLALR
jgi:hypothetical protein